MANGTQLQQPQQAVQPIIIQMVQPPMQQPARGNDAADIAAVALAIGVPAAALAVAYQYGYLDPIIAQIKDWLSATFPDIFPPNGNDGNGGAECTDLACHKLASYGIYAPYADSAKCISGSCMVLAPTSRTIDFHHLNPPYYGEAYFDFGTSPTNEKMSFEVIQGKVRLGGYGLMSSTAVDIMLDDTKLVTIMATPGEWNAFQAAPHLTGQRLRVQLAFTPAPFQSAIDEIEGTVFVAYNDWVVVQ